MTVMIRHVYATEDDLRRVIDLPYCSFGSDGVVSSGEDGACGCRWSASTYGYVPRVLEWYVRELGVLTLEDAVRRLAALPAEAMGSTTAGSCVRVPAPMWSCSTSTPSTTAARRSARRVTRRGSSTCSSTASRCSGAAGGPDGSRERLDRSGAYSGYSVPGVHGRRLRYLGGCAGVALSGVLAFALTNGGSVADEPRAAAAPAPPPPVPARAEFARTRCPRVYARYRLPGLRCVQLTVPADHWKPGRGKVHLMLARLGSASGDGDPLLIVPGGPGGTLEPYLQLFATTPAVRERLLRTREVLVLDPRGSGASRPALRCRIPAPCGRRGPGQRRVRGPAEAAHR